MLQSSMPSARGSPDLVNPSHSKVWKLQATDCEGPAFGIHFVSVAAWICGPFRTARLGRPHMERGVRTWQEVKRLKKSHINCLLAFFLASASSVGPWQGKNKSERGKAELGAHSR